MTVPPQPYDDREATFDAFARHVNAGRVAMADHALAEWTQRVAAEPVEDVRPRWARRFRATRNRRASIAVEAG